MSAPVAPRSRRCGNHDRSPRPRHRRMDPAPPLELRPTLHRIRGYSSIPSTAAPLHGILLIRSAIAAVARSNEPICPSQSTYRAMTQTNPKLLRSSVVSPSASPPSITQRETSTASGFFSTWSCVVQPTSVPPLPTSVAYPLLLPRIQVIKPPPASMLPSYSASQRKTLYANSLPVPQGHCPRLLGLSL